MKPIMMLVFFLLPAAVMGGGLTARVAATTPAEAATIARAGVTLEDARVCIRTSVDGSERSSVAWNAEKGFVTVRGSVEALRRLEALGYRLTDVRPAAEKIPAPAPERLDTIPYQFGWPRTIFNGLSLYENAPAVADMNNDGQLEISVTNAWGSYNPTNPPQLIVWRRTGAYLAGFPTPLQPGLFQSSADAGIAAMGDVTGDSRLEIVCGDENGYLYAFNPSGQALAGFPIFYGADIGVYTPALADLDGDGKCEIAVISHDWDYPYANAFLHVLKVSPTGAQELPGFPFNLQKGAENGPSIGDLEGDGELEIVVATGGLNDLTILARVIALTPSGEMKPGFPWVIGRNSAGNNPTLYDIDNNGTLEILIRCMPDSPNVNGIYAVDHLGRTLPGYPFPISYGNPSACVAVGDMTGDGIPELAYGGVEAVDSGKVWVYNLSGELLPGYPARVYRTWVDGSVAVADVDGDGFGDVVCGTNGVSSKPGVIRAFNRFGQEVSGFPLSPGNPVLNSFTTHPALVDIDGDGDTEIFAGRLDKYVYGWDTPGIFDSTRAWRMFKGNAARTGGQIRSPFAVGVREEPDVAREYRLEQNYPNPFNGQTRIRYRVPDGDRDFVRLAVFDLLGRRVITAAAEAGTGGAHEAVVDAAALPSGVYLYRLEGGPASLPARAMLLLK